MIQLLCKKRFRFKNPHADMIKREVVGTGDDKKTIQVESGAKFEQAYFEVTPNVLTAAPDWVKSDRMFEWGTKDGDILEVVTKSTAEAEAAQQKADNERVGNAERTAEEAAATREQLSKMTKVELLKHASDKHELELSPSMTKDAILEAIATAEKESTEEGA
jgi:hypothetical protein